MMDEENHDDVLQKLVQKIQSSLSKPEPNSSGNEIENQLPIEKLNGNFHYKNTKRLDAQKYKAFVKKLKNRLNLSEKTKDSMLDVLDSEENEEKLEVLWFNNGKGYIYRGWYLAEMKNGKIDIAYVIYAADFQLSKKLVEDGVLTWWYIFPIGWKHWVESELTMKQKEELNEWCELQLNNNVRKTFENHKF